ncbi:MAG: hypothetical protein HRU08_03040 [Oleispira sp.]|nr:hypothetical protein [Oleispira sp.]
MSRASLNLNYDMVLDALGIRAINHFSNSRESLSPQERLKQVKLQAKHFVDDFKLINQQVQFMQTLDLVSVPYPVKSAFGKATNLINPYLYVTNRLMVLQFATQAGTKTLLFSPSDLSANAKTPYFQRLLGLMGKFKKNLLPFVAPKHNTVEQALDKIGIKPEQVDFICYDNLHTQDLRKWLGSYEQPAYFPNAKLLVMHQEWEAVKDLLPLQNHWYCPNGVEGIDPNKIIPLHSSIMLGDSLALIHTPGHTQGSQSLVVNTKSGIMVCSQNGIAVDNYSPAHSTIYGIADYVAQNQLSVIPNGDQPELRLDQYISMILEKTIADKHPDDDRFLYIMPSSELSARWQPFALSPTLSFGEIKLGEINQPVTQPIFTPSKSRSQLELA